MTTPTPELVALFHPLKYYVRAARSQLGSCRPDDDEDDADFWDGLTAVMKAMDGDSGWDDAHVHGWRMVDGIRVFSITPPSGLLPPQEFVRYDDHLATRPATLPQGVVDSEAIELDAYDAGLLNDFGGGDVNWWQDYIRAELERAHDYYQSQLTTTPPPAELGKGESHG